MDSCHTLMTHSGLHHLLKLLLFTTPSVPTLKPTCTHAPFHLPFFYTHAHTH